MKKKKLPIYPGDLRIFTMLGSVEETVVTTWSALRRLLMSMSREALIREFAPDEATAVLWNKTLKEKYQVVDMIKERYFVK